MDNNDVEFARFRPWFYAAAIYNFVWGMVTLLFPAFYFWAVGMDQPNYPILWQLVGMFVLVFAPGYYWAGRRPYSFRHYILIGWLGKLCGPVGYAWFASTGALPKAFGWTILTNDIVWLPIFTWFLIRAAAKGGGWRKLVMGE